MGKTKRDPWMVVGVKEVLGLDERWEDSSIMAEIVALEEPDDPDSNYYKGRLVIISFT